jgi:predicted membrane channel-forming protein YqfA (hemolysin III family)
MTAILGIFIFAFVAIVSSATPFVLAVVGVHALIWLLVWLIVAGIIFAIVKVIIDRVPMDATFKQLAYLVLALIIVLILVAKFLPLLESL